MNIPKEMNHTHMDGSTARYVHEDREKELLQKIAKLHDDHHGTPCEQIRHRQREEELLEAVKLLREHAEYTRNHDDDEALDKALKQTEHLVKD